MDTLSDIDPEIVEGILSRADDFIQAQSRVEKILSLAEQKVTKLEQHLARQLSAGVSEETAAEEYSTDCRRIRSETESLLQELTKEYEVNFPPVGKVE
jgi:hypothetical protein